MFIEQAIQNKEDFIRHWVEEMNTNTKLLRDAPTSMRLIRRMKNIAKTLEEEVEKLNKLYRMRDAGEEYV